MNKEQTTAKDKRYIFFSIAPEMNMTFDGVLDLNKLQAKLESGKKTILLNSSTKKHIVFVDKLFAIQESEFGDE